MYSISILPRYYRAVIRWDDLYGIWQNNINILTHCLNRVSHFSWNLFWRNSRLIQSSRRLFSKPLILKSFESWNSTCRIQGWVYHLHLYYKPIHASNIRHRKALSAILLKALKVVQEVFVQKLFQKLMLLTRIEIPVSIPCAQITMEPCVKTSINTYT